MEFYVSIMSIYYECARTFYFKTNKEEILFFIAALLWPNIDRTPQGLF